MSSVVFYRDSNEMFECDVKIEGTSYEKTKTRLVLEFSDRSLMFPGFISEGHVSIEIPRLSGIQDKTGKAVLEVIADSTYFEAWTSDFEVANKQSIQVSEVKIGNQKPSIVVEAISKEPPKKEILKKEKLKSKIFKETCSERNRKFAEQILKSFKTLNESQIRSIKKDLKNFNPSSPIQKWAKTIFINPESISAKYCMLEMQKKL